MKTNLLDDRNAIRGESQPIRRQHNASVQEGAKASNNAANTLKQTIQSTLADSTIKVTAEMTEKERETQQLHEIAMKPPIKRPFKLALIDKDSKMPLESSIQRIGENFLAGTYESDQTLQSVIKLLQHFDDKQFKKLPKIWQNRFKELSLDEINFIYVDERLVISEELRRSIFRSLHWGNPGRDAMLQAVAGIWWP